MMRVWRLFVDSRSLAAAALCAVAAAAAAVRLGVPRGDAAVLMAVCLGLALAASVMRDIRPRPAKLLPRGSIFRSSAKGQGRAPQERPRRGAV